MMSTTVRTLLAIQLITFVCATSKESTSSEAVERPTLSSPQPDKFSISDELAANIATLKDLFRNQSSVKMVPFDRIPVLPPPSNFKGYPEGYLNRMIKMEGPANRPDPSKDHLSKEENQMYIMPASGFGNLGGYNGTFKATPDSPLFMPILGQKIITIHKDFGDPKCEAISRLALDMHNEYRAKHGVPKLTYSKEIEKVAQAYAETLANSTVFQHSKQEKYGENLFMREGAEERTAEEIVREGIQAWYDEEKNYQEAYGNTHPTPAKGKVGHFTALVWKDTRELGIGVIKKENKYILVANYFPRGNNLGLFAENVPRPLK